MTGLSVGTVGGGEVEEIGEAKERRRNDEESRHGREGRDGRKDEMCRGRRRWRREMCQLQPCRLSSGSLAEASFRARQSPSMVFQPCRSPASSGSLGLNDVAEPILESGSRMLVLVRAK